MATDFDSAGVYFLSVEEFEWRPKQDNRNDSAGKKNQTAETGRDSGSAGEQPDPHSIPFRMSGVDDEPRSAEHAQQHGGPEDGWE